MKKLNIIIDTDPGTDDAVAIALASVELKEHIIGLISSYGNVDGYKTYQNLINLAHLLHIDVDVIRGAIYPLQKDSFSPTNYHGENGFCGVELPSYSVEEVDDNQQDYIDRLYNLIKSHKKVNYVSLASMTNLATLITRYPDSVDYFESLTTMGGGLKESNMPGGAEYNFSVDPIADKIVLESKIKKYLAPLDLTHTLSFTSTEVEKIIGMSQKDAEDRYVASDAYSLLARIFFGNLDTAMDHGYNGSIIHDAATFAYLIDPSQCKISEYLLGVDENGAVFELKNGSPVFVIRELDKQYFFNLLSKTFSKLRGE